MDDIFLITFIQDDGIGISTTHETDAGYFTEREEALAYVEGANNFENRWQDHVQRVTEWNREHKDYPRLPVYSYQEWLNRNRYPMLGIERVEKRHPAS